MFKVGSLGCKMLIIGCIVILLAGVFGVATGPALREEIRMQQYHRWALDFEETWECIDIIGVAENTEGYLEIYLRGPTSGACTLEAGNAFYATDIYYLERIAERFGYNVDTIITTFAPLDAAKNLGTEVIVSNMVLDFSRGYPGFYNVPEYLQLWEGMGE